MSKNKNYSAGHKDIPLEEVRQKIDALDTQIQALISDRARLASAVRESKGELDNAA